MVTFNITDVYTSKRIGGVEQPSTPIVGEYYRITVEFDVKGNPVAPYPVFFEMANRLITEDVTDLTPGHKQRTAEFWLPLDGEIPWEVEIDPWHYADGVDPVKSLMVHTWLDVPGHGKQVVPLRKVSRKPAEAHRKGVFEPGPPPTSIDHYSPITVLASQHFAAIFHAGGKVDRMVVMMGRPTSDSWQQVKSASCSIQSGAGSSAVAFQSVENPSLYPVYYWNHNDLPLEPVSMVQQCELELRNVRVDRSKLRTVSWKALDEARASEPYKFYGSAEQIIESGDPKITSFVHDTLGTNYRQNMAPYDAARRLFQEVLARTTYYYPEPGEPDLRPSTATGMVDTGFGDCGGFSILLVALFRNIGFPARTACGVWAGIDAGHCWCELFFPGHGWFLCDGSAGNSWSEDGKYAFMFGNLPDLNRRLAVMRGNSFNVDDVMASWLQGPFHYVWGTATLQSVVTHTLLMLPLVLKSSAMQDPPAAVEWPTIEISAELVPRSCPCVKHGGYRRNVSAVSSVDMLPKNRPSTMSLSSF